MTRKVFILLSVMIAFAITLAACTTAATPTLAPEPTNAVIEPTKAPEPTMEPEPSGPDLMDPATLEGTVYSAGSSTVYPVSEVIAEGFQADGFTGEIKIDSIGSGAGFERFCKTGETDISNASRRIKDSEIESCAAINRKPIEFRVGTDAIVIVVNNENDFATDITTEELGMIFSSAQKWSDVRADWPAEDILRFVPGTDSGTFDFFTEVVIQKPQKIEKLDDAKAIVLAASNQQASEDDNVLVQGVIGNKYAVGYFGFAYYQNQKDNLNALALNGVAPDFDTAESGEYLLSRPLFIYSDASIMKEKPQVAGFIYYYLDNVNDIIENVGYFPASDEALQASMVAWEQAVAE